MHCKGLAVQPNGNPTQKQMSGAASFQQPSSCREDDRDLIRTRPSAHNASPWICLSNQYNAVVGSSVTGGYVERRGHTWFATSLTYLQRRRSTDAPGPWEHSMPGSLAILDARFSLRQDESAIGGQIAPNSSVTLAMCVRESAILKGGQVPVVT